MAYIPNNFEGWTSEEELQWLYDQAKKYESIVEVGCWKGRSTHALLSGCRGNVYAVDHFRGSEFERRSAHKEVLTRNIYPDFVMNVGGFGNLKIMKMSSYEAQKRFAVDSVDMVYIDAGHTFKDILSDLALWTPIARKLVCGQDWKIYQKIKEAVRIWFGPSVEFINTHNGIWWVDKEKINNSPRKWDGDMYRDT